MVICQTCGDKGFSNALIHCDKCQASAIHLYCFPVLPENFDEYGGWFCVDCELEKAVKSSGCDESGQSLPVAELGSENSGSDQGRNKSVIQCFEENKAHVDLLSKGEGPGLENCPLRQSPEVCCSENVKENRSFTKKDGLDDEFFDDAAESSESKTPASHGIRIIDVDCCNSGEKHEKLCKNNGAEECNSHQEQSISAKNSQMVNVEQNFCDDGEKGEKIARCDILVESSIHNEAASLETKNLQLVICDDKPTPMDFSGDEGDKSGRHNILDESSIHNEAVSLKTKNLQLAICDERTPMDYTGDEGENIRRHDISDESSIHNGAASLKTRNFQLAICDVESTLANYSGGEKGEELEKSESMNESSIHEEAESYRTKNHLLAVRDLGHSRRKYCEYGEKHSKFGRKNSFHEDNFHQESEHVKAGDSEQIIYDVRPLKVDHSSVRNGAYGGNCNKESEQIIYDVRPLKVDHSSARNGARGGKCNKESELCETTDSQLAIIDAPDARNQICYACAQPIQEPIWRGSLNISNSNFACFHGVVAHLSTLACSRVHEEARMLPRLLSLKMLPRYAVWPKAFEKWGPSYDSIGLYIFPDSKSGGEKAFGNLVLEMIHQDLALRAELQNAEILIFTSTLLPMDFWRFQTKLYLFGVFRKKQTPCLTLDFIPEEKEGPRKAKTRRTQSPVSTLINDSPGGGLHSPTR